MKTLMTTLLAGMLLISASASAETIRCSKNIVNQSVTTGSFNSIKTTSSVDVEYRQSPTQSIVISAPDNIIKYIDVKVVGNELKVGFKPSTNLNIICNSKMVVKVNAPNVNKFTTSSSGDIDIKGVLTTTGNISFQTGSCGDIEADNVKCATLTATTGSSGDIEAKQLNCTILKATTKSSGDIKISNLKASTVTASTESSGDIKLSGNCTTANYTTNSSGDISAKSLDAVNVNARTNSSGDISCVGKNVQQRESSSGDIHVYRK